MKIKKILIFSIILIIIFLNIDYNIHIYKFIEGVKEQINSYTTNISLYIRSKTINNIYPNEIEKKLCSKEKCILKDGTELYFMDLGWKQVYTTKTITAQEYKPAEHTICTEMGWCDKNDDWWQGANNYCKSKGMYLPSTYMLKSLYAFKDKLPFSPVGYYWTSLKSDEYSNAYEYSFELNRTYNVSRILENNIICVLRLRSEQTLLKKIKAYLYSLEYNVFDNF